MSTDLQIPKDFEDSCFRSSAWSSIMSVGLGYGSYSSWHDDLFGRAIMSPALGVLSLLLAFASVMELRTGRRLRRRRIVYEVTES